VWLVFLAALFLLPSLQSGDMDATSQKIMKAEFTQNSKNWIPASAGMTSVEWPFWAMP
jgi:hypothetical protein